MSSSAVGSLPGGRDDVHHATTALGAELDVAAHQGNGAAGPGHANELVRCRLVVRRLGHGLVSTSANLSGEPTPALYTEISPELVRKADYVAYWRQDDTTRAALSRVVRVLPDGSLEGLRD